MKKIYLNFLILCFLLFILTESLKNLINFNDLYLNSLAENLTANQIKNIFEVQKKWEWISYTIIPLLLLIKTSIVTSILYIGTFFYSKTEVTFKNIFNSAIKCEFVFLIIPILKIIWFYFFQTNYTLEDIQYFFPLSALNITGYQGVDPWLIYPLQVLNLFEVAYIIYLSYQIGYLTKTNADTGLKIVAYSYVPALLLWVTVVMFFTLNYS
jgi:hypothetical protein